MKRRNLIVLLSIALIGLLGLSISFSLAWYMSATRLSVDTIYIEMDCEKDLLISTSSEVDTFKSKLEKGVDDLQKIDIFKPVSSMLGDEWLDKKETKPKFRDCTSIFRDSKGNPITPSYETYGFFSQEFYLMCDDDVYATVDNLTSVFKADEEQNKLAAKELKNKYPGKSNDEIAEMLNKLEECLRISILLPDEDIYDYVIIDPFKSGKTLMGGVLDNSNDKYYDYYTAEDGESYEILYGEIENRENAVFDAVSSQDSQVEGEFSAFNAKTKKNVHKFNLEESLKNGMVIKEEPSVTLEQINDYDTTPFKIPLYANTPRKIVLSIYLEGWDLDCINSTMGAHFISDISFKVLREMAL